MQTVSKQLYYILQRNLNVQKHPWSNKNTVTGKDINKKIRPRVEKTNVLRLTQITGSIKKELHPIQSQAEAPETQMDLHRPSRDGGVWDEG